MHFSVIIQQFKGNTNSSLPKLENSSKTLICCVITEKAFMHTQKRLYPFVHIVSRTFDHIPRKSACHSVWLWGKKDVHICRY